MRKFMVFMALLCSFMAGVSVGLGWAGMMCFSNKEPSKTLEQTNDPR